MVSLKRTSLSAASWFTQNRDLFVNSASLVATLCVNSVLGFVFWWYAAKVFAPKDVGAGSAAIAALTVLSTIGVVGMATLLIGELPTYNLPKRTLLIPAMIVSALVSTLLAFGFGALATRISPDLGFLSTSLQNLLLFATGVVANTLALVFDAATIALLRGTIQFSRNLFAAVIKLVLLLLVSQARADAMVLYWTWTVSLLLSFAVVFVAYRQGYRAKIAALNWTYLFHLWPTALAHHALNIVLEVPPRILPLLVTVTLGATINASFFVAWMIALFSFSVADSLAMVIYAIGSGDPSQLQRRVKLTLKLSFAAGAMMVVILTVGAPFILQLFGDTYSQTATDALRILALAVFPISMKDHYIAVRRVSGHIRCATRMMVFGATLEIGLSFVGAVVSGLTGLAVGWVLAVGIEGIFMMPLLYRLWVYGASGIEINPNIRRGMRYLRQMARSFARQSSDNTGLHLESNWLTNALQTCLDSSLGLVVFAIGNTWSRLNYPWAEAGFWVGLAIFFAPLAYRLFTRGLGRQERLFLVVALGLGLYLFKVLHSPTQFTLTDEILHLRSTENILRTGRLFQYNPLLPVSAYYPGFESALTAFIQMSGLSTFQAGVILVGIARILFTIALFLFYERASSSDYIAGIASVIYTANPFYLFVTVQISYESLALPFAAFILYLLTLRNDAVLSKYKSLDFMFLISALVLIVTHHLTTYMLIVFLCLWLGASWLTGSTRKPGGIGVLPVFLVIGGTIVWLFSVATVTVDYLYPQLRAIIEETIGIIQGGIHARQLFQAPSGLVAPIGEQIMAYGAVVLLLVGFVLGLLVIIRRNRQHPLMLALAVAAIGYPVSLGFRFTDLYPITTRSSEYVFVALAFVIAMGVNHSSRICYRWWSRLLMTGLALVVFIGGIAVGWSPWARQPGKYLVASEVRSIEPTSLLTSQWTSEYLGTQVAISADRVSAILLSAYGYQNPVDTINSGLMVPLVYFSSEFGSSELAILCAGQIRYVVVDRRLSTSLPMSGTYFWLDEPYAFQHKTPIAEDALLKFDSVDYLSRIYDAGSIVIYDTQRLDCGS